MMITLPGQLIGKIKAVMSVGDTPETEVTLCDIIEGDFSEYITSKKFDPLFIQEN